jgi:SAM-dependent methyltransferase
VARARLPEVSLSLGDMHTFDLGRTFDAVTCLFSSVGYLDDPDALSQAVSRMARHLSPGGVLVVDGWVKPEAWLPGINVHALAADADGTAAARVIRSRREGNRTYLEMRYLVATGSGFEDAAEEHVLTLFTDEEYRTAFAAAGLEPRVVASPMGPDRDRYVAVA